MDIVLIVLEDGRFIEMQWAERCGFYTKGCDTAIDYTLYNRFYEKIDSRQMDYVSIQKKYTCIRDAIADIIAFALGLQGRLVPAYYII